ncbi:tetratricopeptide repeat protein [Dyella silvatica]|uniref:tetratricopeptide repeat protein n=1 Tax=Dyella silvatica TaxID=2992128 RepID=UPI00224E721A|nr:tetratricopeptide repeat protein [Dyella silvatica]
MKLAFYLAAAAMIATALALLLLPLVRHGRRLGRPRSVFVIALLIAFALPLASAGLYLLIGTPVALNGVVAQAQEPALNIEQAVAEMREHLAQKPDDLQGWMLLAQTYAAMRRPADARQAYDQALRLSANNTTAMIGWAEADSMQRDDHLIDGRSRELLEQALKLEPENQRGLWLLGISDFQHDHYADAAATWRRLQPLLEPGSSVAKSVAQQIALADARAGAGPATAEASSSATTQPALQVQVALAPALKDKLAVGDTLFIYARAEQGPPMPLAVARMQADALPATVTLTDAMAMTPQRKLSSVPRVFVGARISKSGQPIAQSGDLEGDAGVVDVNSKTPIKISIDKVH